MKPIRLRTKRGLAGLADRESSQVKSRFHCMGVTSGESTELLVRSDKISRQHMNF